MDFTRVKSITISYLDLHALTNQKTSNPIAESEVPEMLRHAIRAGVDVLVTDPLGKESYKLILNKSGQFQYEPLLK